MNEWFPTFRAIGQHATDRAFYNQLWQQFRHTPIRDLVRLQLSGRLNWKARVAESDLPANAKQKITDVVKATRLWRLEKSQIANELVAHFQDGQQRGQGVAELVSEFGETDTVARLMRSAKKRNRSLVWKTFVAGAYAFVAFLVFYAGLAVWFNSGKPNPSVDYFAVVSADALAVPDSERAWPIYRDAWTKYQFHQLNIAQLVDQQEDEAWNVWRPGDEKWPNLVAFLQQHQPLVEAFRQAGRKAGMGLELRLQRDYATEDLVAMVGAEQAKEIQRASKVVSDDLMDDGMIGTPSPHVKWLWEVSRVLAADSFRAAEDGDAETVVRNVEAIVGVGPQAAEYKVLFSGLVAMACERIAYETIQELVIKWPGLLNDEQLKAIAERVGSVTPRWLLSVEGELAFQKDIVQRIYTNDGNGDGRLAPAGVKGILQSGGEVDNDFQASLIAVVGPAAGVLSSSRKDMEKILERAFVGYEARFKQPIYKQPLPAESQITEILESLSVTDVATRMFLEMLMPRIEPWLVVSERTQASRDATLVGLAAHRYCLRHDQYPQSADQLVPDVLEQLPPDPVTGESMRYRLLDGQPLIYSVGADLDDDGGVEAVGSDGKTVIDVHQHFYPANSGKLDGDWVLWPRDDD